MKKKLKEIKTKAIVGQSPNFSFSADDPLSVYMLGLMYVVYKSHGMEQEANLVFDKQRAFASYLDEKESVQVS